MNTWRIGLVVAATLSAGCTGEIEEGDAQMPGDLDPSASPTPGGTAGPSGTAGPGGTASPGGTAGPGGTASPGGTAGPATPPPPAPPGTPTVPAPTCSAGIPGTSQIPRLSNVQYDRTVRDLLGVTVLAASGNVEPSVLLATDQEGGLSDLGWSAYQSVAEKIAAQVMKDPASKAKFMSCTPAADNSCLHDTIVSFGRRAFRRPLSQEEVAGFDAFVAKGKAITPTGAPEELAEALLFAFLVSPSFLQRSEITEAADGAGHYTLSGPEIASRLSYMLWGSTPDAELDLAADSGQLATPEQVVAQADRMLKDPKARDMIASFHRNYLLMGTNTRWDTANRDTTLFPAFNKGLLPVFMAETEMFFDEIVYAQSGAFQSLLTSPVAFVNASTAPLYGLNAADFGAELKKVELDPAQRPGFLTRLGFLNAYSSYTRTSPILRGAFITKQVIGLEIGAPPPGAEMTELPSGAEYDTNRKAVDAQTAGGVCAGCHHNFINPPGFVMEAYDAAGAWQTKERVSGAPIDTVVDAVIDGQTVHITNPAELMARIAASPSAQKGYASKWVAFAFNRASDPADACTVEQLTYKMNSQTYPVLNLIKDLTLAPSFRVRALISG